MGDWSGVALGMVELEVDEASATWSRTFQGAAGGVLIGAGGIFVSAKAPRGGTSNLLIGSSEAFDTATSISFSGWRLIQRDATGEPIVLFEASSPVAHHDRT